MRRHASRCLTFLLLATLFQAAPAAQPDADSRLNAETFQGLALRGIGPALMSGRIADIAIHPSDRSTWYVAAGSGGVWKTVNAGTTWTPIFDHQGSYSIGCLAIDPDNPQTVWVGTGENVSGRHVGYGDGIYKSLDGGQTWSNKGLGESEHISKILIDPRDSRTVYAAAEGPLWAAGGQRGVFKSSDGGENWEAVLEISENTGVTDLEFDPRNPDILYAAAYQRRRHVWAFLGGGPESGIFKTTDGGSNWRKLTNGLPKGDVGKIGLAVSPLNPDLVYATIEASSEEAGFYRSPDSGESWERRSGYLSGGTGPHYYQEIYASPHKLDRVYQMEVWMHVTDDGGQTFQQLGEPDKHSDNHALAFLPDDPDYLLAGCDGGLYQTFDHAKSWQFVANLPITQIYKLALDNDTPFYNVVGGTQDNNTQVGPSRTLNVHGIQNSDWYNTVSGDGYACQADPEDPNIIYSEWQNGGLTRFDRRNGELLDIQPQPAPDDPPERWNWDAPILISPHSHTRLYYGSQRLWRSDDRGDSWRPVSGDLSRGRNRYEMEFMGRVWSVDALYDNGAMSWYGNLTSISESPLQEGLIYAGTDDGLIQATEDGGQNWRTAERIEGVPEGAFVNEVKASLHDADVVFAVLDDHKRGDYAPYLVKSSDRGRSWASIAGDLPARHLMWSVVEDHIDPDLLFAGSEFGIFFTLDGGARWIKLTGGVPAIPFRDLEIQRRENDLVGASFGRGFYILDDYSPLRHVDAEVLDSPSHLFPVKDALLYVPATPLGLRGKANLGSAHFTAPNPPFGAVFTYYLRDPLQTARQERREREAEIRKEGGDVPFPGWDRLQEEQRQQSPSIILTVRDAQGGVVRRIEGSSQKGFQRVAWDLRYPPSTPAEIDRPPLTSPWESYPEGPLVKPGPYSVSLSRLENGRLTETGEARPFQVVPLDNHSLGIQDRDEVLAFQQRTSELLRKAAGADRLIEETLQQLQYMRQAVLDTPSEGAGLLEEIRRIELQLRDISKRLSGDPVRSRLSEPSLPSVLARLNQIIGGHWNTTSGPTGTHRQSFGFAANEFDSLNSRLRSLMETDLKQLEEALEAAGAPWTPGRKSSSAKN